MRIRKSTRSVVNYPLRFTQSFADAALKYRPKRLVITSDSCKIGSDPFLLACRFPVDFKVGISDYVFKQYSLGATVAITKRMNHVEVAIELA